MLRNLTNMRKIQVTIIFLIIISCSIAKSQSLGRQVGLRAGYRSGFYYQVTTQTGNAETGLFVMAGFHEHGVQLTGLKVIYEMALSEISPDLILAWGYGGHAGFIFTDHVAFLGEDFYFYHERFCPVFGIDGWGAAEYRFRKIPLILSLNVKPYIEMTIPSFVKIIPFDFGFSCAYTF